MTRRIRSASSKAATTHRASSAEQREAVLDVTVVVQQGGYPSAAIAPIEIFHSAGVLWHSLHGEAAQPRFRVQTASIDGGGVKTLCSLGLTPEFAINDIKHTDVIIVAASGQDLMDGIAQNTPFLPWLREWHARGAYIAGICTGVGFLAQAGLLDGRQGTTHWAMANAFRQRFPKVLWQPEQFVTEDCRVLCSGGVYASIDLSLYLVDKFCGREVALQCAKSLLVGMPRSRQSGYSVLPLSRPHSDDRIRRVEHYLQQHLVRKVSIDALAARIGMSPRTFIRRFKAATGRLPGAYMQMLRVSSAKEMLERGGVPIQVICSRVGYEDVAFFRSLFKRHTGMTPAEYRSRFAGMNPDSGALDAGRLVA
jgi:transcriptional regulator GlxA family with amidase domain